MRTTWLVWLAASGAAVFAAFGWPPLAGKAEASGLSMRLPAGWSLRSFDAGERGATLRIEGSHWAPLILERHRSEMDVLRYADGLPGRREGLSAVRLGSFQAFRAETVEQGRSELEGAGRIESGTRGRLYMVFRDGDDLYIASWAEPLGLWDRWRAERTYRRVLSSLEIPKA